MGSKIKELESEIKEHEQKIKRAEIEIYDILESAEDDFVKTFLIDTLGVDRYEDVGVMYEEIARLAYQKNYRKF